MCWATSFSRLVARADRTPVKYNGSDYDYQDRAITCADNSASWPRDPERYRRDALREGARHPLYGDFASGITPCAFWPRGAEPATRVDNTVGVLVVQNQWASETPLPEGRAMHRALRGSRLGRLPADDIECRS